MAVIDQEITDTHAIYNGDSCEVIPSLPSESIHLSVYSPPFCGLYNYSSSDRDMSNCRTYNEFFQHYEFLVNEIHRVTIPGRISAVHCMDVPAANGKGYDDFPGDIIALHKKAGFDFIARHAVWKEPLAVRLRTMAKGLAHKQVVDDSSLCDVASADYLLLFRKRGENPIPIAHPVGLMSYAGEREIPGDLLKYRGWKGKQTENRYSHWIWRQYASAFWDDVRISRVLPYKESKEPDDEKHVHPLQLDVIERIVVLRSNPGEIVLTPFMGVGSEVYGAVINGRRGVGIELKPAYYKQAKKNLELAKNQKESEGLFEFATETSDEHSLAGLMD
jgi:DNA modification methylase